MFIQHSLAETENDHTNLPTQHKQATIHTPNPNLKHSLAEQEQAHKHGHTTTRNQQRPKQWQAEIEPDKVRYRPSKTMKAHVWIQIWGPTWPQKSLKKKNSTRPLQDLYSTSTPKNAKNPCFIVFFAFLAPKHLYSWCRGVFGPKMQKHYKARIFLAFLGCRGPVLSAAISAAYGWRSVSVKLAYLSFDTRRVNA